MTHVGNSNFKDDLSRKKKLLQRWPVGEMIVSKMACLRINSLNDYFSGINDFKDALSLIKGFQK